MFPMNHDLHCHTGLSRCSSDKNFSAQHLLDHAVACGYDYLAVTNHMWDPMVPDVPEWYLPQDIEHIRKVLPLPQAEGVRFLFGCETEYGGGTYLGLHPSHYQDFDLILVPVNHYNITGCTEYPGKSGNANCFLCQLERLEMLLELDLPWKRVGIAHLQWYEVKPEEIPEMLALEQRYEAVFREYAKRGAGIELNAAVFIYTDPGQQEALQKMTDEARAGKCVSYDKMLWLFSLAKKAGCKFYLGSDSHTSLRLDWPRLYLDRICKDLGLTEQDRFLPEERETECN